MAGQDSSIEFNVIDKVVAAGPKRLDAMFRETFASLDEVRKRKLTAEQKADLETLSEAYELAKNLVVTLAQLNHTRATARDARALRRDD